MEVLYDLILAKCMNCREKVHCTSCERELSESLCGIAGVESAQVDLKAGKAKIVMNPDAEDDVEEAFDIAGYFIN